MMGIFGAQKVSHGQAAEVKNMVEAYFQGRGLVPSEHQLNDAGGYGWWLVEGSAKVFILIQDGQQGAILRITAPLVYLPDQNREIFYRRLLDLNGTLSSCALSTHDDVVLVVAQRPAFGLVQEELDDLVWHVAYVADLLDNKLADEFHCRMYSG